jgi:hypothetical protein
MTLPILPASAMSVLAASCVITDHRTGATEQWRPNAEQLQGWRVSELAQRRRRWLYAAKPRQIGNTTARTLELAAWTAAADGLGHRVRAAIVVDNDDKTRERAAVFGMFSRQLGLGADVNTERARFAGGSVVEFLSAGSHRLGASGSFQRLLLSELSFWPAHVDTYGSLTATLSLDGFCEIDTTCDLEAGSGLLARRLWRDNSNRFDKLFFPVEIHEEYRADPSLISDDEWRWSQSEGFTRRDAAAWWLTTAVRDLAAGDVMRAMREFPQKPEHMWQASKSRWVAVTPQTTEPVAHIDCAGHRVPVWRSLADTSGQVVVGVDTATGKDRDRSAVVVIDKKDNAICAAFTSNTTTISELAAITADVVDCYSTKERVDQYRIRYKAKQADLIVEDNGVGEGTVDRLRERGFDVQTQTTDVASKYDGLLLAREAVMSGHCFGPSDLADECDELHQDEHGNWKGRKDLLMAIGFALRLCKRSPYIAPRPVVDPERRVDAQAILRHLRKPRDGGW